jgi:hypothetical protein
VVDVQFFNHTAKVTVKSLLPMKFGQIGWMQHRARPGIQRAFQRGIDRAFFALSG